VGAAPAHCATNAAQQSRWKLWPHSSVQLAWGSCTDVGAQHSAHAAPEGAAEPAAEEPAQPAAQQSEAPDETRAETPAETPAETSQEAPPAPQETQAEAPAQTSSIFTFGPCRIPKCA